MIFFTRIENVCISLIMLFFTRIECVYFIREPSIYLRNKEQECAFEFSSVAFDQSIIVNWTQMMMVPWKAHFPKFPVDFLSVRKTKLKKHLRHIHFVQNRFRSCSVAIRQTIERALHNMNTVNGHSNVSPAMIKYD